MGIYASEENNHLSNICVLFFALEEDTMNSSPTGEGESLADESKTLHALYAPSQTKHSPRKQRTFRDVTTNFLSNWRLRNERRNSVLMTRHYQNLDSASNWLKHISFTSRPITSTLQILLVVPHQYEISPVVPQVSFRREMCFLGLT